MARPTGAAAPGFRSAVSTSADLASAVAECAAGLGNVADAALGIAYFTDAFADDADALFSNLEAATGVRTWVGAVGWGILVDDREIYGRPALAVMVTDVPADSFRLLPSRPAANDTGEGDLDGWIAGNAPVFGLVHGDPRPPELASALASITTGGNAFLVGGLASGQGDLVHVAGRQVDGPVSGVLFGSDIQVATSHTQGCTPIGDAHTITACNGNIIESLDNRPAFEVLKADMGELLARDLRRAIGYIFAALPVPGSDVGDYMVRNIVGLDPTTGRVAIGEEVTPGQALLFTRRDHVAAVADLDRMLEALMKRLGGARPKGAIYVSCLARGPNLFGPSSNEVRQVRRAIGEVPLIGFFANGEMFHDRLYGYTGVLTLFL